MPAKDLGALVARVTDQLVVQGDLGIVESDFGPGFVTHTNGHDLGRDEFAAMISALRHGLSDIAVEVDLVVECGSLVAWRSTTSGIHRADWLGYRATGRPVVWSSLNIARIEDGKLAEHWGSPDMPSLAAQLGGQHEHA